MAENSHAKNGGRKATAQRIKHCFPPESSTKSPIPPFLPRESYQWDNTAHKAAQLSGKKRMNWRDFWNADTPIYVNDQHKFVHYQRIAADIERLLPGSDARVVDYGCGEALATDQVAARCGHLYLCDGAQIVRDRLRQRLATVANVTILSPEEFDTVADRSIDLIVVNSVVQYLNAGQLGACLAQWRRKLKGSGRLVVADVIPHGIGPLTDATALLRFAAANGFLIAALAGLVKTFFSDYRRMRAQLGLAHYNEAEFLQILRDAGFTAERLSWNFGHNTARMAFAASPVTP